MWLLLFSPPRRSLRWYSRRLSKRVEENKKARNALGTICLLLGVGAFFSNKVQKSQDDVSKKKQEDSITELQNQIKILVNGTVNQASATQLNSVVSLIEADFKHIENMCGHASSSQTRPVSPAADKGLEAPSTIRSTQKTVPSTDPNNPFGLQIVLQSDVQTPAAFKLTFSGPISDITFFMAAQPISFGRQYFVDPDDKAIAVVRQLSPPLGPESPMVINVLSKSQVRLISVTAIASTPGGSY